MARYGSGSLVLPLRGSLLLPQKNTPELSEVGNLVKVKLCEKYVQNS
jgi:hypothetical protein